MSEVKRYGMSGFGGGLIEMADGPFVDAEDFDAQRLRADKAEAEVARLREAATLAAKVGAPNFHSMKRELAAAEQHNSELVRLMTDIVHNYNHGYIREMHRAVVNADAALNPNPEAESHE